MRRVVMWACAAVAVLHGCAPHQGPQGRRPSTAGKPSGQVRIRLSPVFVHAPSGLKLQAPKGWGFLPKAQVAYVSAQCRPQNARGELPVMLAQAAKVSTDLTMEALVAGYSKQIARAVSSPNIVKDEQIKGGLGGAEAYEIIFTGRLKREAVEGRQVLLRKDGWFYVITQMAGQADFQARKAAFEEFTASVTFE